MINSLNNCMLCPRNCKINRNSEIKGYCGANNQIKVARAALYQWEEPCISGTNGSGTVFFSNCNLKCVFCQNHKISQEGVGEYISIQRLSEIFLELEHQGAHNINLVTPTHYAYHIIDAIKLSKQEGLSIPILYNSSGYENVETIKLLKGLIDVYLPDIKYFNDKYAIQYSNAPNYFSYATRTIKEMVAQVGEVSFDKNGIIKKGVIIRHLMLPGLLFDSKKIIDFIYNNFNNSVYISIMNQYTPMHKAYLFKEINKPLNSKHYDCLIDYALSLGITNGFIQDSGTSSESFVPAFDLKGIRK